jgi:hypothetical protein
LNWCQLNWLLIRHHVLDADDVVLMSGDHVVVTKSGKMTYGLERFFSHSIGFSGKRMCHLTHKSASTEQNGKDMRQIPIICSCSDRSPLLRHSCALHTHPPHTPPRHPSFPPVCT